MGLTVSAGRPQLERREQLNESADDKDVDEDEDEDELETPSQGEPRWPLSTGQTGSGCDMNILTINHWVLYRYTVWSLSIVNFLSNGFSILKGTLRIHSAASHSHLLTARQPALTTGKVTHETIQGVFYRWFPTPVYSGNGLGRVRNIVSFLGQLWMSSKKLARELEPQVVIASSTYPMDIWVAAQIARHSRAKLVFEVHDLWPLTRQGGVDRTSMECRRWHPFIIWCQRAEDYACRRADVVVSLLPKAADYLES